MKPLKIAGLLAAGMSIGCMASGPPLTAQDSRTSAASSSAPGEYPLLLDRTDLQIGTTVHFGHLPDAGEVNDLRQVRALAHVVLSLDAWPSDVTASCCPFATRRRTRKEPWPPSRFTTVAAGVWGRFI